MSSPSVKSLRAQAKMGQNDKLRRLGASGNLKHAREAECAPRKYAAGGSVGAPVEGPAPSPRLDQPHRGGKKGGKGKDAKGKTNVNVIIMGGGDKAGGPPMMPPPPGPMGPMAGPPPKPPMPMPPPGGPMGGPPPGMPPMRARGGSLMKEDAFSTDDKNYPEKTGDKQAKRSGGGKICRASGGRVPHIKEGAGGGLGRLAKIRAYGK